MDLSEQELAVMPPEAQALAAHYGLQRLPVEGIFYQRTWIARRGGQALTPPANAEAAPGDPPPVGTAIIGMYCAAPPSFSRFHRLAFDEVWHFYQGDPFRLVLLHPDGSSQIVVMGTDWRSGQLAQFVVPAGVWQAGELLPGGALALFGCTMAPGFIGWAFEAGRYADLLARYPQHAEDIRRLSIDEGPTALPDGFSQ